MSSIEGSAEGGIGPRIAAIVLAAGASSRLGQPKQLVEVDGEPLVLRAVKQVLAAGCSPVVVVLGACEAPCRAALGGIDAAITITVHAGWAEGMGSSVRHGMEAVRSAGMPVESVLVTVVDQVQLTAGSLRELLARHAEHTGPATAAAYAGRLGVPAVFRSELFPALLALAGDQGARALLQQPGSRVARVDLPEAAADLDTPEDLITIRSG